jgi:hypothetical protein
VKNKVKIRSCIANLTSDKWDFLSDNGQKAEAFNDFFATVFTSEDFLNVPADAGNPASILSHDRIFGNNCSKVLQNLQPKTSPGSDIIHPRMLKECIQELAGPLTTLFCSMTDTSLFQ